MKSTIRAMGTGFAAALAAALVLTSTTPVSAAPPPAAATVDHGAQMGEQIRKHEGGDRLRGAQPTPAGVTATVSGIDVSGWQGNVDWKSWWDQGKRFAYVKATEGTGYENPYFAQQYNGSYNVGMIRGSYHFARPNLSSGATQANYFVNNGGGWSKDGKTLPGAVDLEYNPYEGNDCYDLSQSAMISWIKDFSDTYQSRTGRWPVFYTSTSWWQMCTGNKGSFKSTNPLWVAKYASTVGTLPYDWPVWTFWQYTSSPIDQNYFNGAYDRLQALANG